MNRLFNRNPPKDPTSMKEWLDPQFDEKHKIKTPMQLQVKWKPPNLEQTQLVSRVKGSIIGMALGDALGASVEFRPQEYLKENPVKDLQGGGTWGLKKGQFTDDTTMSLCLASSLLVHEDFIPYDQLVRYKWWLEKGYMSSTGECFDIGAATRTALDEFQRRQNDFQRKHNISNQDIDFISNQHLSEFDIECGDKDADGNGALMRLAPVPLYFYRFPEYAIELSGISGRVTHGGRNAYDACRYYGALIVAALRNESKEELLHSQFYEKHIKWFSNKPLNQTILDISRGLYRKEGGYKEGIRGRGYIVQSLEAALWAFCYDENSFAKGALAAVNLGDDTDTTAAIYGQLAGACYGYNNLPGEWLKQVYAKEFMETISEWIIYQSDKWQPASSQIIMAPSSVHHRSNESEQKDSQTANPIISSSQKANAAFRSNNNSHVYGQSNWDEPSSSNSPMSFKNLIPPKKFNRYIHSFEDVAEWLKSLGSEYLNYQNHFLHHAVDGFWLVNFVNDDALVRYGIRNEKHRQFLLNQIKDLRIQYRTVQPQ